MPKQAFTPLKIKSLTGFTLIELVIVVTILAILAAVAIPIFSNLQTQARNSATKGALAGIRQAITQYRMNEIASGRSTGNGSGTAAGWPDIEQLGSSHCAPWYDGSLPPVMENRALPPNPWGVVATHINDDKADCARPAAGNPKSTITTAAPEGWIYRIATGEIWANSAENDGTSSINLENCFPGSANEANQTENCY